MKILACSLLLSCFAALSAEAGDSNEMLWDRLILCRQFVVEHPYPAIFPDFRDSTACCHNSHEVRDCYVDDRGEKYR
jgi:hypothetical protein